MTRAHTWIGLALLAVVGVSSAADSGISPRIYGGQDVSVGDAPWAAGLLENGTGPFCTGTLITPHWVMTAAHCLADDNGNAVINSADLTVFVDQEDISGSVTQRSVASIIIHPDYDGDPTLLNDVALLLLDLPATGVDTMSVTSVAAFNDMVVRAPFLNDELQVLGWGEIDPDHPDYEAGSPFSDQLQQVRLDYRDFDRCQDYWQDLVVESAMICAREPNPERIEADDSGDSAPDDAFGEDTCSGDSGGPLLLRYQDAPYLAGITSFGSSLGCGARDGGDVIPGVYTRVVSYLAWLESSTSTAGEPVVDATLSTSQTVTSVATSGQGQFQVSWLNGSLSNSLTNPTLTLAPADSAATLSASGDFSCGVADLSGRIDCTYLGTLAAGASLSQQVTVGWTGAADTAVSVTATPGQSQGDYRVANDAASATLLFTDKPDLAMVMPASASGIGSATVAARVDNLSDHQGASGVEVTLTTSGDATIDSVSQDGVPVSCSGTGPLVCPVGSVAAGASGELQVAVSGAGTAGLSASVSAVEGDVAPANNDDSSTLNLSFTTFSGTGSSSSGGGAVSLWLLALLAYRRAKN